MELNLPLEMAETRKMWARVELHRHCCAASWKFEPRPQNNTSGAQPKTTS